MRSIKMSVPPMFAGLAWAVPIALWTGVVLNSVSGDVDTIGLLLLLPALVTAAVMALTATHLSWIARVLSAIAGMGVVSAVVIVAMPESAIMSAVLVVLIPAAWLVVGLAPVFGHGPVMRVLADRKPGLRFLPLGMWIALVAVWVIVQASPTSTMATEGPFLEVQMLTIAGITGLMTLLFSAITACVPALRRSTTEASRIR